jgi:putative sterol carrier protein
MATGARVKNKSSADATGEFFGALARRGHEPLLRSATGTLRFDLADGRRVEHWYVSVKKGDVLVSHENVAANAVVRIDRSLFDGMVQGRVNAMAAALRGVLHVDGDLGIVVLFQRLFPGPPASGRRRSR